MSRRTFVVLAALPLLFAAMLSPSPAGASGRAFTFELATPNWAFAPTGEHAGDSIKVAGSGEFDVVAEAVEAEGRFVHYHADGTVHRGRWVATAFTSFQDFGAAGDSEEHGGVLWIVVTHFHGGVEHTGIPMSVTSVVNAPSPDYVEGTTVDGSTEPTRGKVVIEED